MNMVRGGASPVQAIQDSGLVALKQQQLKDEAGQAQKQGYAQLGGQLVGALGTQAIQDVAKGEKVLGGLREGAANIGKEISGLFGAETGTNIAQTAAENAAWNAGADAATSAAGGAIPPVEGGMFAPGGTLTTALGGAGAALGAYGAYKGIEKGDPFGAGSSALGAGLGLNAMGFALGPVGWAALTATPVAGALINKSKVSNRERNQRQTENLLKMGFSQQQMQELGRMDNQGSIVFRPDTLSKEQKDAEARKWNEITSSEDPNINWMRQPNRMWGTEGMLSTYGPDYLNKMSEFDRYVATASAIENGGGFYDKKGEVLLRNQKSALAAYEAAKNNPELMAKYQQNYNIMKQTGQDVGIPKIESEEEKAAKERAKQIYTSYND
jgi:hypothetical protein